MDAQATTIQATTLMPDANSAPKGISVEAMIHHRNQGLSYDNIGAILGCSGTNVYRRLREYEDDIEFLPVYRKSEQDLIDMTKARILRTFTEAEIKKAAFKDRAVVYGILSDKSKQGFSQGTTNVFNVVIQQAATKVSAKECQPQVIESKGLSDNLHYDHGRILDGQAEPAGTQGGDG